MNPACYRPCVKAGANYINDTVVAAIREIDFVKVEVRDVVFMPSLEAPLDQPYPFVYIIAIRNHGEEAVTFLGRKWVVTSEGGERTVVEGDGIIGQKPRVGPDEVFSYNSYHTVASNSVASGAYFGRLDSGEPVCVRIPEFKMNVPG